MIKKNEYSKMDSRGTIMLMGVIISTCPRFAAMLTPSESH